MQRCNKCNANILWCRTRSDELVKLDDKKIYVNPERDGSLKIAGYTRDMMLHHAPIATESDIKQGKYVIIRTLHETTCPFAAQHRRKHHEA